MEKLTKLSSIAIAILFSVFITTDVFGGGPWTKAKGKYYFKLSEWSLKFDQHYTDSGLIDPNITTGIYNTFLYAEYGLSDRLTTIFNGSLFSRNVMNNLRSATNNDILVQGDAINAIGDIDLAFKYSLSKPGAQIPIAVSVLLGVPTGVTGKGEFGNLQTGDGEFNQQLQIDIGKGFNFKSNSAYYSAYAAVNNRTKGFSEEFRFGAEFGLGIFNSRLWLSSKLNFIRSFKNGELSEEVNSTSIFANNTEFTSLGVEANLYLTEKIGISANYTSALSGRIIAAAPSYSFGIFIDVN